VHSLRSHDRSSLSIILNNPLNIAEGARRVGRDRAHHYRIAAGSAAEVAAALEIAATWGYVADSELVELRALVDRELGLLYGLTRRRA
jgi:four helix bundle protein